MRCLCVCTRLAGLLLAMCVVGAAQNQPSPRPSIECTELENNLRRAQTRLMDWPQLSRYREANSKLPAPARNEPRIVFMGDSITDGWRLPEYFPGKPYVNRGISGQTTPQMLVRFRPDVIELQPRVVVILAGTNDIAGNTGPITLEMIENNYASMAELARAHGIRVVFSSVLPVSDYGHTRDGQPVKQTVRRPPDQIRKLNEWLKRYSTENGHTYLDYFSSMVDETGMLKKELSDDGLHPNAKGYAIMKPLAEQAIGVALKKKR